MYLYKLVLSAVLVAVYASNASATPAQCVFVPTDKPSGRQLATCQFDGKVSGRYDLVAHLNIVGADAPVFVMKVDGDAACNGERSGNPDYGYKCANLRLGRLNVPHTVLLQVDYYPGNATNRLSLDYTTPQR